MVLTVVSFLFFTVLVAVISWWKTKEENLETADGYFLAGRGLSGTVIAGSMLLTNISAEQIVGLSGQAYMKNITGMAWEVTAVISTIALAYIFLPYYLKRGFTTMPQFLEERYDATTRRLISGLLLIGYVIAFTPTALYAGAVAFNQVFNLQKLFGLNYFQSICILVWIIGIIGSIYAVFGGLKAVAVSDTINGIGLVIGGLAVPIFGLIYLGKGNISNAITQITTTNLDKINAIGGANDPIPFGTIFTGMIFANLFYWCTNQVLIQRTLGAKNLVEGQKGVLFSGLMKLLMPLIVCFPGVIAFHIFGSEANLGDAAYPKLVATVLPKYLAGFYSAVIFGAVLSTYNSFLNSAATLFCFDIYKPVINPTISDVKLIKVAKILGTIFAIFSMGVAPFIMYAEGGLFEVLRKFGGYFNIPTIAIVLIGLFSKKVTSLSAKIVIFLHIILYTLLIFILKIKLNYVHVMGILFIIEVGVMYIVSAIKPLSIPYKESIIEPCVDMTPWSKMPLFSSVLIGVLLILYVVLSPLGVVSPVKEVGEIVGPNFKKVVLGVIVFSTIIYKVLDLVFKKYLNSVSEKQEDLIKKNKISVKKENEHTI